MASDMTESLGDKIVRFIDDRENRGIETVGTHVAHAFVMDNQTAYDELCALLDAGRIKMRKDETLVVVTDGVSLEGFEPLTRMPLP